jgi:uncharacterized protein YcaQ
MIHLTKPHARAFLVAYHGLDYRVDATRIVDTVFKKLGSIQYDPLDVAGRNADLVLFSRVADYRPIVLDRLLYEDRVLLDGWDKMMSVYPVTDRPYFTRVRAFRAECARWILEYRHSAEALESRDAVLSFLADRGPSRAADMKLGSAGGGSWGHRSVAGAALDALFHEGKICVAGKKGAQKTYDLAERLLDAAVHRASDPFADDPSFHEWLVLRRIGSVGILWNRNGVLWQGICKPLEQRRYRRSIIDSLVDRGLLMEVSVEGIDEPLWVRAVDAPKPGLSGETVPNPAPEVRFLAPLDNMLWDRELVEALFGFRYRWEVYTPAVKREYGYYVLPILYGSALVGRIEPVIDRKAKTLDIRNIWIEESFAKRDVSLDTPPCALPEAFGDALRAELDRYAAFLGADAIKLPPVNN